jgi:hypothetical protein
MSELYTFKASASSQKASIRRSLCLPEMLHTYCPGGLGITDVLSACFTIRHA